MTDDRLPWPATPRRPRLSEALDWMNAALCAGKTALFFSDAVEDRAEARGICAGCPVRQQCDQWARRSSPQHGIWAGRSAGTAYSTQAQSKARQEHRQRSAV